jgi:hypothetical protein
MARASLLLPILVAVVLTSGSRAATPAPPIATHPQPLCSPVGLGTPDDPLATCLAVGAPIGPTTAARSFAGSPADVQLMTPQTLHTAYALPTTTAGSGTQTIAIVDAFDDPTVQADLDAFDAWYGLPALPACAGTLTTSCFLKVNQSGATSGFPAFSAGWATEIALDVETAHALCQNCKVILVEATTNSLANLAAAVDTAAGLGATVISNSYGTAESGLSSATFATDAKHYRKSGVAVIAAAGDGGYGTLFPADVDTVVSVGGTTLSTNQATGAYLGETVWFGGGIGTGSGCSAFEPAEPWQTSVGTWPTTGCAAARSVADVSADADPASGMYVRYNGGWYAVGGTSLSAPIIAAAYALAANPSTTLSPVAVPYAHGGTLHDVTMGENAASCSSTSCSAAAGYDGPTGLGTPNGIGAFVDTGAPPASAAPPTVTGTLGVGQPLTGALGTWWATQAISYQRAWLSCTTTCSPTGATGAVYTVRSSDVGHTIELQVVATDAAGSQTATSTATAQVAGIPPAAAVAPAVSGTAAVGQTLGSGLGTWTGTAPIAKTRQWLRCDAAGANCAAPSGMTGPTYVVKTIDIGHTVELQVTATNPWSTGVVAVSAPTGVVPQPAPAYGIAPSITGSAVVGGTLTGHRGSWTNAPTGYAYQWLRCTSAGAGCAAVASGGHGLTFTLHTVDKGHRLELQVTATNAGGATTATSAPSDVVS